MQDYVAPYGFPTRLSNKLSEDKGIKRARSHIKYEQLSIDFKENPSRVLHNINKHIDSIDKNSSKVHFNKMLFVAGTTGLLFVTLDRLVLGHTAIETAMPAVMTVVMGLKSFYYHEKERTYERAKKMVTGIRCSVIDVLDECYSNR